MDNNNINIVFVGDKLFFKVWRNIVIRRLITGYERMNQIQLVESRMKIVRQELEKEQLELEYTNYNKYIYYNSPRGYIQGLNWFIHDFLFGIKDKIDFNQLVKFTIEKRKSNLYSQLNKNGIFNKQLLKDPIVIDYINKYKSSEINEIIEIDEIISIGIERKQLLIIELEKNGLKYLQLSKPIEHYINNSHLSNDQSREWSMYNCVIPDEIQLIINSELQILNTIPPKLVVEIPKRYGKNGLLLRNTMNEPNRYLANSYQSGLLIHSSIDRVEADNEYIKQLKQPLIDKIIENELQEYTLDKDQNGFIIRDYIYDTYGKNQSIDQIITYVKSRIYKDREMKLNQILHENGIIGSILQSPLSQEYIKSYKQNEQYKFNINEIISRERLILETNKMEYIKLLNDNGLKFDLIEYNNHSKDPEHFNNNNYLLRSKIMDVKFARQKLLQSKLKSNNLNYRNGNPSFEQYINTYRIDQQNTIPKIDQIVQNEIEFINNVTITIKNDLEINGLSSYYNVWFGKLLSAYIYQPNGYKEIINSFKLETEYKE